MPRHRIKLSDFLGRWSILREIRDETTATRGRLEGQAVFRQSDQWESSLTYEERGQLTMDGSPTLTAERTYLWFLGNDPNTIDILFQDGRPFHRLDLNCTMPFSSHFCSPDEYNVSYDFRSWPVWRSEWRVRGPRKDYRIWSRFRFMGDASQVRTPCHQRLAGAEKAPTLQPMNEGNTWRSKVPTES